MESISIISLLPQIKAVIDKYEGFSTLSGENFNIFQILGLESREVRLHSAFLAELLNPKGSHGQGSIFLELFTKALNFSDFDAANARVYIEKHIGFINNDGTEGGRIDLVVEDSKGRGIIVENKIYAADQSKQMLRYYKYGQNHYFNGFRLLYLNLIGDEPSTGSTMASETSRIDYTVINYKKDVINWLEACRKEAATLSMLRETISQYINLLKLLTGQSINTKMENEIAQVLASSKDNINAAYTIRGTIDQMERILLEKLKKQLRQIAGELKLDTDFEKGFGKLNEETYLKFLVPNSDVRICFGFDRWRDDFSFGIDAANIDKDVKAKFLNTQLLTRIGADECKPGMYENWYYLHYIKDQKLRVWKNAEVWAMVLDGSLAGFMKEYIKIALEELEKVGVPVANRN